MGELIWFHCSRGLWDGFWVQVIDVGSGSFDIRYSNSWILVKFDFVQVEFFNLWTFESVTSTYLYQWYRLMTWCLMARWSFLSYLMKNILDVWICVIICTNVYLTRSEHRTLSIYILGSCHLLVIEITNSDQPTIWYLHDYVLSGTNELLIKC